MVDENTRTILAAVGNLGSNVRGLDAKIEGALERLTKVEIALGSLPPPGLPPLVKRTSQVEADNDHQSGRLLAHDGAIEKIEQHVRAQSVAMGLAPEAGSRGERAGAYLTSRSGARDIVQVVILILSLLGAAHGAKVAAATRGLQGAAQAP